MQLDKLQDEARLAADYRTGPSSLQAVIHLRGERD